MEPGTKRLAAALALSVLLPQLTVNLASRLRAAPEPQESVSTSAPAAQIRSIALWTGEDSVKMLPLEDYVRGVVLAEMMASFQPEALKAQAVAARSYALRRAVTGDRHPAGAVCADPGCCQAWISDEEYLAQRGTQREWAKIAAAVEATAGEYLCYEGLPADATYFSCSGGRTESALDVWGEEIPYLQSVSSADEEAAAVFSAQVVMTPEEFADRLGTRLAGEMDTWLGPVTKTQGGGVATAQIGDKIYTGVELRAMLGLNSTVFTVTVSEGKLLITTRGKGHRVGMSQYGAEALAKMGYLYQEILERYYPGTYIDKTGNLG